MRSSCLAAAVLGFLAMPLLAQESAKRFDAPMIVAGHKSRILELVDYDGDSFVDAVGAWEYPVNDFRIEGWRNDGAGRLVADWTMTIPGEHNSAVRAVRADLDGDGLGDFVMAIGKDVHGFLSNGAGAPPTLAWSLTESSWITDLVAADFDGDGLDDFALARTPQVRIYLVQPGLPPTLSSLIVTGVPPHTFLEVAELDGDGAPDLVVVTEGSSVSSPDNISFFPVLNGAFGVAVAYFQIHVWGDPVPCAGDIDQDGDVDVVVFGSLFYHVLRATGPSGFVEEAAVLGGPATELVDVDGDGDLDGCCCGGTTSSRYNVEPAEFRISIQEQGSFRRGFPIGGLGASSLAGVADLDHDGDVDLVAGRCVHYASGPIAEPIQPAIGAYVNQLVPPPSPRRVHDADSDGDPDLEMGAASAWLNDGAGGFESAAPLVADPPAGTTFVGPGYAGDFDGDGDPDVLVEHHAGSTFVSMRLLSNAGGGDLVDGGPATAAGARVGDIPGIPAPGAEALDADFCLVEDVDGDGSLDLVARDVTSLAGRIWLNDGTGFMTAGQALSGFFTMSVADMTGDGLPDLLGIESDPGPVVLRPGAGGGSFGPSTPIPVVDGMVASEDRFDLGDIDGDGDLDVVAIANVYPACPLRVRLNDGGATGYTDVLLDYPGCGDEARRAFFVDVDDDGLADVVANGVLFASGGVQIFRRNGPGATFDPPVHQIFSPHVMRDVDGDGDVDSLGRRVVRNIRHRMPEGGRRRQFGTALAGSGGMAPTLGCSGPCRAGEAVELRITGGLGASVGGLIGFIPRLLPSAGHTLFSAPVPVLPLRLGGPPGIPGAGCWSRSFVLPPGSAGLRFLYRAGLHDPGVPAQFSMTGWLEITVGTVTG